MMQQLRGTTLKRFVRDFRRAHPLHHDVVLVLQSVVYPVNVGSLFRIADACRLSELILTGITPVPPNATISKVGRNRDHDVPWRYADRAEDVLADLRQEGFHICALEITDQAAPYHAFDYPERLCLVVGNEDHGVTRSALALCDSAVFVPMYGKGKSLNVHVSAAVVLYHLRHNGPIQEGIHEQS
jgi:tRNA (guanosine-2'-O-)-methyltransferase